MALGDAYWQLADAEGAETHLPAGARRRPPTTAGTGQAPALAYKRLALLACETDLPAALDLLREARRVDPTDPETLYAIGELSFAVGELDAAAEAFRPTSRPRGRGRRDAPPGSSWSRRSGRPPPRWPRHAT
jgi:tetratricopeptide (TPR) repeat protein